MHEHACRPNMVFQNDKKRGSTLQITCEKLLRWSSSQSYRWGDWSPKRKKHNVFESHSWCKARPVCSSRAFPDATSELQRLPPQFALTALEDISLGDHEAILPDAGSACCRVSPWCWEQKRCYVPSVASLPTSPSPGDLEFRIQILSSPKELGQHSLINNEVQLHQIFFWSCLNARCL